MTEFTEGRRANLFMEKAVGSIESGKLADLVLISDDILTCPDEAIKIIKSLMTIVGGESFIKIRDSKPIRPKS